MSESNAVLRRGYGLCALHQNLSSLHHAALPRQDFVNFHLTGRWCASVNNASIRWHYSTQRPGGWPTSMLQTL